MFLPVGSGVFNCVRPACLDVAASELAFAVIGSDVPHMLASGNRLMGPLVSNCDKCSGGEAA